MKLVRWKRFTWDLTRLETDHEPNLPSYYTVRAAARDEEKAVRNVIFTAFGLDSAWGDSFKQVRGFIESQLTSSFLHRAVPCLVITHGVRIIAASALNTAEDAPSHLISGPCVLAEYRNRGLGTALLHESLLHLKTAGLDKCNGVCKENVSASKFVYPKFGSATSDFDFDALAASL
jgi:ribosomal protein S18 acetylase RimI-like enzyme